MHQRITNTNVFVLTLILLAAPCRATINIDRTSGWTQGDANWGPIVSSPVSTMVSCDIFVQLPDVAYQKVYKYGEGYCGVGMTDKEVFAWLHDVVRNGVFLVKRSGTTQIAHATARIGKGNSLVRTDTFDVAESTTAVCYMDGPLNIDHGTVSVQGVEGHKAVVLAQITCDGPAEVVVTGSPRSIKMNNGMTAKILINGKSTARVSVANGAVPIDISSTLSGVVSRPGGATGTGIIRYEVQ